MNPDAVGKPTLRDRDDGSANDSHNQEAGAVACQWSEFGNSKRENAREHDGIEKTDQDYAVHRKVSAGKHRNCNEGSCADRREGGAHDRGSGSRFRRDCSRIPST